VVNFWIQSIEVIVDQVRFKSSDLAIEFETRFNDKSEPNDGEVKIYNLTDNTTNRVKKGDNIIINAGYREDTGTIFMGVIDEVQGSWEDLDRVLTLKIGDATDKWANTVVNLSFKPGIKASQIINATLGRFGLAIGEFRLPRDVIYSRGRTLSAPLQAALREICADCGAKFHISNGTIYIRDPNAGTETGWYLRPDSGLIATPQPIEGDEEKDYRVRSLLNYRLHADSIIRIESRTANGLFRVVSGKHIAQWPDRFETELEVAAV